MLTVSATLQTFRTLETERGDSVVTNGTPIRELPSSILSHGRLAW